MRTKALLGLAALAVGLSTSVAQNVYSLNVVGYVNQTVQANTWYMWGNPLSSGNNTVGTVLTNLTSASGNPNDWVGALVYGYTGGAYSATADTYFQDFGWFPGTIDLTPGNGFFFFSPTNGTVTYVGQVATTNSFIMAGPGAWSMVASAFPATNTLVAMGLIGGYNAASGNGDLVYRFNKSVFNGYDQGTTYFQNYGWFDGDPQATAQDLTTNGPVLNVGEAVFYQNANPTVHWGQNFTIN